MCPLNQNKNKKARTGALLFFSCRGLGFPLEQYFCVEAVIRDKVFMITLKGKKKSPRRARWHCCSCLQHASHFWALYFPYSLWCSWRNVHNMTPVPDVSPAVFCRWRMSVIQKSHSICSHAFNKSHREKFTSVDLNALLRTHKTFILFYFKCMTFAVFFLCC